MRIEMLRVVVILVVVSASHQDYFAKASLFNFPSFTKSNKLNENAVIKDPVGDLARIPKQISQLSESNHRLDVGASANHDLIMPSVYSNDNYASFGAESNQLFGRRRLDSVPEIEALATSIGNGRSRGNSGDIRSDIDLLYDERANLMRSNSDTRSVRGLNVEPNIYNFENLRDQLMNMNQNYNRRSMVDKENLRNSMRNRQNVRGKQQRLSRQETRKRQARPLIAQSRRALPIKRERDEEEDQVSNRRSANSNDSDDDLSGDDDDDSDEEQADKSSLESNARPNSLARSSSGNPRKVNSGFTRRSDKKQRQVQVQTRGSRGDRFNIVDRPSAKTVNGLVDGPDDSEEASSSNQLKHSTTELQTAAGHHHGHHGHYYQHVEVPKKKTWKFGFKRGNHKHEIEKHEKGHKHKFHTTFKWHAKEKCKKKKHCKSVGKMTWEYKHAKKHHHH